MYNRYVRNDAGIYERVRAEEPKSPSQEQRSHYETTERSAIEQNKSPSQPSPPEKNGLLSGILGKLKLDGIDTGDLLLLLILFLLFREDGDEELLIALGLLFIL